MKTTDGDHLAVIPARGGSKGILRKNMAPVAGKPLMAWTIETALECSLLCRVIVSTDDREIADVARHYGAEVPFLRPTALAGDDTAGIEPVLHAARWLGQHEHYHPYYVIALQPTSPLRTAEDIQAAIQLARERQADTVVSVCHVGQHPYWMKRVTEYGKLADFLSLEQDYTRRQDLPAAYALNGAIYLARREVLLTRQSFYTGRTYAYVMPEERSLDVDTPWHLHIADLILKDRMNDEDN